MKGMKVGGYEIVELIGVGGMSEIYRAYDRPVDRFVAVKVLLAQYSKDDEFRARFDQEAKAIALLEHKHILPIYAYGQQEGILYFVVRYMTSGSLAQRIDREGPLPLEEVCRLSLQIASALDYAHAYNVLHRDFKTENVLLDGMGDSYLADFGLAQLISDAPRLTGNFILGTPAFMSPEQARGEKNLTPASDQYALGVVMFHMITGRLPFDGDNSLAILQQHIREKPPSPRSLRPDLPPIAEKIVLRALAKDPAKRFADCMTLADSFARAATQRKVTDRIDGNMGRRIDEALERVGKKKGSAQ